MMAGFVSIGATIKQDARRGPTQSILLTLRVKEELDRVLPQILFGLAGKASMRSYHEGRLTISTPSPTVSQEVFLHREKIRRALNKKLEKEVLKEVKAKIKIRDTE